MTGVDENDDSVLTILPALPLAEQFNPIERILLTSNGSLQRTYAGYLDTPVRVSIQHNIHLTDKNMSSVPADFKRCVILSADSPFCVAWSRINISDLTYLEYFLDCKPGIGQLLQHFRILPTFELYRVGRNWSYSPKDDDHVVSNYDTFSQTIQDFGENIWREYTLTSEGLVCRILEVIQKPIYPL